MKLFFAPETCSLAPHIVLHELAIPFELVRVNNKTKRTAEGTDFRAINPKGYVAALQLEDGQVLTEGPAILQYLADLQPASQLVPPHGRWQRVRLQEWLNFISVEIHGTCSPLFNAEIPDAVKAIFRDKLFQRFDWLDQQLGQQEYLLGTGYSVADVYLYTVMLWMRFFAIDLQRWPAITAFMARIACRPAVIAAQQAEAASLPC